MMKEMAIRTGAQYRNLDVYSKFRQDISTNGRGKRSLSGADHRKILGKQAQQVHRARRVWWRTSVMRADAVWCHRVILTQRHLHQRTQTRHTRKSFLAWGCDQQDDNLCGACARPTDKRSLVRCGGGEQRLRRGVLKESTTKAGKSKPPRRVRVGWMRVIMGRIVLMCRGAHF